LGTRPGGNASHIARTAAFIALLLLASGCGGGGTTAPRPAAPERASDFVGIYADDVYFGDAAYKRDALARQRAAGIKLIRQPFPWSEFAKDPARYDEFVGAAARAGIRVLPVVLGPEPGAAAAAGGMAPPSSAAAFARYATALVDRYGPRGSYWRAHPAAPRLPIHSWQVWNEPNIRAFWASGPDPAAYARLLETASRAIRKADPDAEVVTAGLPNSHLGIPAARFLAGIYAAGAKGSFDAVGIHSYAPTPGAVVERARAAADVVRRNGDDAKLWMTEVGWGTGGKPGGLTVSTKVQADYIAQTLRDLREQKQALNLRGVVVFQWRDPKPYAGRREIWPFYAGLIDDEGEPKPALAAFAKAAAAAD
jgi:polysaccharide biosynthesis protein PslG